MKQICKKKNLIRCTGGSEQKPLRETCTVHVVHGISAPCEAQKNEQNENSFNWFCTHLNLCDLWGDYMLPINRRSLCTLGRNFFF